MTRRHQDEVSWGWGMLLADDIAMVDETSKYLTRKLDS